jgi:sulfur carrier protein ThiS
MDTTIDLKLFASLARHAPANAQNYPIPRGTTIAQLLEKIQVPLQDIKLIFVNGVRVEPHHPLNGGERVGLFPPIGGG